MTANKIYFKKINNIPFEDIYLHSKHDIVEGVKSFRTLNASNVEGAVIYDVMTKCNI